ncbi:MAG TPA: leucine-rich repeat protein [Clostridia bacterium]|nr:leucine-rich repeat protein [Clostridia bacterium]
MRNRRQGYSALILLLAIFCIIFVSACSKVNFKLTFVVDDEVYYVIDTKGDEEIKLPDNPVKEGFVFDGWFWDKDAWEKPFTAKSLLDAPLSADMSVYAKWLPGKNNTSTFLATFVTNGGTAIESYSTAVIATAPVTIKEHHTFAGWYIDIAFAEGSKVTFPLTLNGDITLYAKWTANFSQGLEFTLQTTTNSYFVKTYTGSDQVVNIPSTFNGLPVVGINARAFEGNLNIFEINIPASVTSIAGSAFADCIALEKVIIAGASLQSIGNNAFTGCESLAEINLPAGVTTIGNNAFSGCSALKELNFGVALTSVGSQILNGCTSLERMTIPGNRTLISYFGTGANDVPASLQEIEIAEDSAALCEDIFKNCNNIKDVFVPWSVNEIGQNAFTGCTGLEKLTVPYVGKSLTEKKFLAYLFGASSYSGSTAVPSKLIRVRVFGGENYPLPDYAFYGLKDIEMVEIDDASAIGQYAFYGCQKITSVILPLSSSTIGASAFENCKNLYAVSLHGRLTAIGANAFKNTALFELTIPDSVTSIGTGAFAQCTHLESLTIGRGVTAIGNRGLSGTALTKIEIPGYVTEIALSAFENCEWLTEIVIPGGVTKIGNYAFKNCTNLTSATLNDGLTEIGTGAFSGCTGIAQTEFTVPQSVTQIGEGAFSGWKNLTKITLPFVGRKASVSDNDLVIEGMFGYIFGKTAYNGGTATLQQYYKNTKPEFVATYYIPASLEEVVITGGRNKVHEGAFMNCTNIKKITLPDYIEMINYASFENCTSLVEINMPESLLVIERRAFVNCSSLTEIALPAGLVTIDAEETDPVDDIYYGPFYGCTSLKSITIPFTGKANGADGFKSVLGYIFGYIITAYQPTVQGATYQFDDQSSKYYHYYIPQSLENVTVMGDIGKNAFYNCTNIKSVTLTGSVTKIGESAFYNTPNIKSITVPSSVTVVGYAATGGNSTWYCEAAIKPQDWYSPYNNNNAWNFYNATVVWGCTLSADKTYVVSISKTSGVTSLHNPYRAGYTFSGWATEENGEPVSTTPTGKPLYAVWTKQN